MFQVTDMSGKYCTPRDEDKARLFHVKCRLSGDGDHASLLTLRAPGVPEMRVDLAAATSVCDVELICTPDRMEMRDFGDEAAAWFDRAIGISGSRLTGVAGHDGFERKILLNPKQGDAVPVAGALLTLGDEAPYLLTSTSSLADLNTRLVQRGKEPVDMRRFRPNIVVEGLRPWEEDTIRRVRIGGVEFFAWQRCGRCAMTTIDRDTLKRSPEPLATLSTFRERANGQRNFGMHLIPVAGLPSRGVALSVGEGIEILEYDADRRSEWLRRHPY